MKKRNERIKDLLNRFFEGQTSDKEERELYLFFRRDNLPEEFASYRSVIKYFETGLADELDSAMPNPPSRTISSKKRWIVWSSIAASFLLILFAPLYFLNIPETPDPLEGSYIIRNGMRITDLKRIRPELEATIQNAFLQQEETEQFIEQLSQEDNRVENEVILQVLEQYSRILENIQDDTIRNEVKIILLTNL